MYRRIQQLHAASYLQHNKNSKLALAIAAEGSTSFRSKVLRQCNNNKQELQHWEDHYLTMYKDTPKYNLSPLAFFPIEIGKSFHLTILDSKMKIQIKA